MLRDALFALVASVALGAGVEPGMAAMHGGGGFQGGAPMWIPHGFHSGGGERFHGGAFGRFHDEDFRRFHDEDFGRFHDRDFHHHFHDYNDEDFFLGVGFAPYAYPPYDSCWQPRQVLTHYGWRWIEVWVCG